MFHVGDEAVALAQLVEGGGQVVQHPGCPLFVAGLSCGTQRAMVVVECGGFGVGVVVHIAQHGIQLVAEGRVVQLVSHLLGLHDELEGLGKVLLAVAHDSMMQQAACQSVVVVAVLPVVAFASGYERVGVEGEALAMDGLREDESVEGAVLWGEERVGVEGCQ